MRTLGRMAAATAAASMVAAVGCGRSPERRDGPLVVWSGSRQEIESTVAGGSVTAFGLPTLAVREELVLDRVDVTPADPSARFVGARVAFLDCPRCRRRPGYLGLPVLVTSVCAGAYPPREPGATYDVAGLRLFPGDAPILLVYATADAGGRHELGEPRIHYRTASGRRYAVTQHDVHLYVTRGARGCDADAARSDAAVLRGRPLG